MVVHRNFINLYESDFMKEITLKLQDNDLIKLIEFLKTISSVHDFETKEIIDFPTLTEKQIIAQANIANQEIKDGKIISQGQLRKDIQNW